MNFKEIKIKELIDFIESDFYKTSDIIPISRQRAISQAKNPSGNANDVALILALDESEKIIGYIGMLPGIITIDNFSYYWNSCWWVDSEKGKMAAMPLFYKMLKISNQKMIFFDLSEKTKAIIENFNFQTKTIDGFRCFLRFNFHAKLSNKNSFFKAIKSLLLLTDCGLNLFRSIPLFFWNIATHLENKSMKEIDNEAEIFITKFKDTQLIPTQKNKINWIVKYPWIITQPNLQEKELSKRYFFSWISNSFSNKLLKVFKNQQIVGVLFFTFRDGDMKLPYSFFYNQDIDLIVQIIYQVAIENHAMSFTTFNASITERISSKRHPFIFLKKIRKYIAYPKYCINLGIENKTIQDGDGDVVFC
ncbi:MAG: hypothetical protein A3K10_00770 [Bacteroidetes bacterium RIFCSPLOWO2_12_FULL_31_6]|nr:MAG: hypothetical protein A3K10_00770 [Bacteroidetes bacterium RIFCSPLOWO2_12_FULL_31_6]